MGSTSSSFAASTAVSKESAAIANVSDDGRPLETPLTISPGTTIYGPAVSRGSQWDRVTIEAWHTDVVPRLCTVAWIDADGSTLIATRTVRIAQYHPCIVASNWRLRRGLYLAMWWDLPSVGWCKVEADQELVSGAR